MAWATSASLKSISGKNHGEGLNVAVFAAGESGNGGGVDSAAQKNTERNVGDQVLTDGAFQ